MQNMNEKPVCHRAEDLVTYLYGEASAADARDFAGHLQRCDACRAEFGVFKQVHESVALWRNEALGATFSPSSQAETVLAMPDSSQPERKLSALAALREFFSVSPLWLRSVTACAAVLLCVLAIMAISRSWNKPAQVAKSSAEEKRYTETEFNTEVAKKVDEFKQSQTSSPPQTNVAVNSPRVNPSSNQSSPRRHLASTSVASRSQRTPRLTQQEREQLAADLRLIPGMDDAELPLGLTNEPKQ